MPFVMVWMLNYFRSRSTMPIDCAISLGTIAIHSIGCSSRRPSTEVLDAIHSLAP
jgi:hypothetical protein